MKIRNSVVASFLLLTLAVSCQSTEKEATISLDNKTIQDFSSYTSIGYGSAAANTSTESNTKKAKSSRNNSIYLNSKKYLYNQVSSVHSSTVPFTLIGQGNGKLANLKVQNGDKQLDIEISEYCELPNFIAFAYGSNYTNHKYEFSVHYPYEGENLLNHWELYNTDNIYFLSKKTGKIYDFSKATDELGLRAYFIGGTEAFYVRPDEYGYPINDSGVTLIERECNYYRISEGTDSLVFTKAFSFKAFKSMGILKSDKYGNITNESGTEIITTSGTIMSKASLPSGADSFQYDAYLNLIYTKDENDNYYYLNATSDLVKAEGPVGCQVSEDETEWKDFVFKYFSTLNNFIEICRIDNTTYYFNFSSNNVLAITMLSDFSYSVTSILETHCEKAYALNNALYYVEDNSIYKYDPSNNTKTELTVDGYRINDIDMDDYGNITVSGYDSSLNSFTGYLTQDDKIVLEPIVTDGYLTYSLTPLN